VAAQTFGDCWRTVRLYVPAAPTFLVREWVNVSWKRLAKLRHWSFLQGELRLTINAARALSPVTVTRGSATVSSAGLFLAGDAGRQFRTTSTPIYTVQTVTNANSLQLDAPYGETSSAVAAASIFDGYMTMPADFESFRHVADPYNSRRIGFWYTPEQIRFYDPTWSFSDASPRALVARGGGSTYTPTLGAVQYAFWPWPTTDRSYPALYNKQAARIDDTTIFHGVLADAAEVIIDGALAEAALWPGTADQKNPYFNAQTAQAKKTAFLDGIQHLSLREDDQAPDDFWNTWPLWDLDYGLGGGDHYLRSSDATVGDYF
jgi:hypothetical protein